ncbi:MAG: hypothetical protein IJW36_03055 [Clostridia bacterium]|nr:hypothetical protein [Clostridia bacterium]
MKNLIEKRKSQLQFVGVVILALGVILAVTGVVLLLTCGIGKDLSVLKLVFGIILLVVGIAGLAIGVIFSWTGKAVVATKGSIAEDNLGKGTVNMNKCENCGAEIEAGKTICDKCEENLKP